MDFLFFRTAPALSLTSVLLLAGCRLASPVAPAAAAGQIQLGDDDRILVLAPHPDDEVLGAGGVLREAVERGIPVRVVFLTHGDSNEWSFLVYRKRPVVLPRAALAMGTVRQREAVVAAEALGVPAADLTFLGYPDHGTLGIWRFHWGSRPPDRGRITRARAVPYSTAFRPGAPFKGEEILTDLETLLLEFRPTRIFVSHPADHHPDHAALYLFTRVALWDLQGEAAATLHPFLVHYPRWPGRKGFRPAEELSPPARLLAGFNWQARELSEEEIAAKRQALTAHRSQWGYSASRLLPFVRPNELYGDLAIPVLGPGGAVRLLDDPAGEEATSPNDDGEEEASELVDLHELSVRLVGDSVEIGMDLQEPLSEGSAVSLSAFGYRRDRTFGAMPKLELRIEPHAYAVRDQIRILPRSAAWAATRGRKLVARLPLTSLGNPKRLFLQVRTSSPRTPLGQTPWWIVELRPAAVIERAAVEITPESGGSAAEAKAPR
jgi:LmbE family N-acetylglucosaminyl deacetylase